MGRPPALGPWAVAADGSGGASLWGPRATAPNFTVVPVSASPVRRLLSGLPLLARRHHVDLLCVTYTGPVIVNRPMVAVNEALEELEREDPDKAQIVLLRYFSGLTTAETAEVLGLAERTLDRQWRYIRAWLLKRLE